MASPVPQVPQQLANSTGGFFLLLFNFLKSLVAAITGRRFWTIVNITHADSPYTASSGQWVNCNTTLGNIDVIIPSKASSEVLVQKVSNEVAVNEVITSADAGLINGQATQVLTLQYSNFLIVGQGPSIGAYIQS